MEEIRITETGLRLLETLEKYQFLTAAQLTRAGHFKNLAVIRRLANDYAAQRAPLVHCKDFGSVAGIGRLHKIYALTEYGAEILAEYRQCEVEDINHLTGKIQFSHDYNHRLEFIEAHIAIREWAEQVGAEIDFFCGYFEVDGANRTAKDALKLSKKNRVDLPSKRYIIPDGVFLFEYKDKKRLCALEIHRGKDSKIITEQLDKHMEALYTKAIQNKYKHPTANFLLSVYENASIMESVKTRMLKRPEFSNVSRAIHFATIEGVKTDLKGAWSLADNTPITIFA